MFPPRLLMIHNPTASRQDNIPKLSGRQQFHDPFLEIRDPDVEPWGDDARFVDAAVELDDDFSRAVVVDFFEFANVAWMGNLSVKYRSRCAGWWWIRCCMMELYGGIKLSRGFKHWDPPRK